MRAALYHYAEYDDRWNENEAKVDSCSDHSGSQQVSARFKIIDVNVLHDLNSFLLFFSGARPFDCISLVEEVLHVFLNV